MEEDKEKTFGEKINEPVENKINELLNEGIKKENVDYLYKLVDIHKDIENEKYWKEKIMRYREYGNYSEDYGRRGVKGTGRGRYRDSGYRGEEMMDEMAYHYGNYNEGRENYGADDATLESLEKMLDSVKKFMKHLKNEASSQEEIKMIKETAREISEM